MRPVLAIALSVAAPLAAAHAAPQSDEKKLVATMRSWLDQYRRGKYLVGDDYRNIAGKSVVRKAGIITKEMFQRDNGILRRGQFSHREEITVLLEAAGKATSEAAAWHLLEYCAVGLDATVKYTPAMVPFYVRGQAELALRKHPVAGKDWLTSIATGAREPKCAKPFRAAVRAAALFALSRVGGAPDAGKVALSHPDHIVRLAAIELLGKSRQPANLGALAQAVGREKDPRVRQHLHLWIARLISSVGHKVAAADAERAATQLSIDLRSPESWHFTSQLTELLRVHASVAFPADLIDVLQRCQTPKEHAAGRASARLRDDAHRQLTSITGAYYPADATSDWRAFWQKARTGFTYKAPPADAATAARRWLLAENGRRTAAGNPAYPLPQPTADRGKGTFFSIPVRGSHVLFVLDVGHAMRSPLPRTSDRFRNRWPAKTSRHRVVTLELADALRGLPTTAKCNVITFSDRIKRAFRSPAFATKGATDKAVQFAQRSKPARNYDLGAALVAALGLERLRFAQPGGRADEIFVVSSHMNQAGAIKAPDDLIALVAEASRFSKTRIHTVYIGAEDDPDDKGELGQKTMRSIAELTGGTFIRP